MTDEVRASLEEQVPIISRLASQIAAVFELRRNRNNKEVSGRILHGLCMVCGETPTNVHVIE